MKVSDYDVIYTIIGDLKESIVDDLFNEISDQSRIEISCEAKLLTAITTRVDQHKRDNVKDDHE